MYVSNSQTRSEVTVDNFTRRIVPAAQWPGDDAYDHLKFALRYEGLNLGLLRAILPRLDPVELAASIRAEPTSAYSRRLWFLYEKLTDTFLDIPNLTMGNYVPLAEPSEYYAGPIRRSPRHRVALNLLGDLSFCFIVRRTPELVADDERQFDVVCQRLVQDIPSEIFQRALDFLYLKETRSSFAIERETPDQKRATAFVGLLQGADHQDYFQREALIALQNTIVDARFANSAGWRDTAHPPEQNFVSGRNAPNLEGIHFIPPRPQEISILMES